MAYQSLDMIGRNHGSAPPGIFTAQAMSALNLETPLVSLLELPTATLRVWAFGARIEEGIKWSPLKCFRSLWCRVYLISASVRLEAAWSLEAFRRQV